MDKKLSPSETYKDHLTPWLPSHLVVLPRLVPVAELLEAQQVLGKKDRNLATCMANDIFVVQLVTARLERIRAQVYDDGD